MAAYMAYWPGEQLRALKKAGDTGPIRVVLGSIHSKMLSIESVQVGDIIYPVTMIKGTLCVLARLPVEKKESAFEPHPGDRAALGRADPQRRGLLGRGVQG